MKNIVSTIVAIFGFVLFSFSQTIVTDRPDQTESSSTIEKKSFQIETALLINFSEDNNKSTRQILLPTTLFRYGLSRLIELRVLSQLESVKNELTSETNFGVSDLEFGSKIQILKKENINTEIAFLTHLVLPTGSTELSVNKWGTKNKLAISHSVLSSINIGYNIGYNYFGEGKGDFNYSFAFGFSITDKLGLYIEPFGEVLEFNNHKSSFDSGFTYLIKDNSQLDFSFGTGINHTMNYLSIGYSINIR